MKRVTAVIAGGLLLGATALTGCGDAEKVSALETQLKEAESRLLFVSDSLSLDCQTKLDALQAEFQKEAAAKTETTAPKTETPTGTVNTGKKGAETTEPVNTGKKGAETGGTPVNTGKKGG